MVEQNTGERSPNDEVQRQKLIEYFKDAKVGDAKYQAFFDRVALDDAQDLRTRHYADLNDVVQNPDLKKRIIWDSTMHQLELKIALLEQSIHQKKIEMPNYHTASATLYLYLDETPSPRADETIALITEELHKHD